MNAIELLVRHQEILWLFPAAQMGLLAVVLANTLANRLANRCLAALLFILANVLAPIDTPFVVSFAIGPLVWFYTRAMTGGGPPTRPWLHLAPGLIQFTIKAVGLILPGLVAQPVMRLGERVELPVAALGTFLGLCLYGVASLRRLRTYRRLMAQQRSDDDLYAATWLSRAVGALILVLGVRAAYQAVNLVRPLSDGELFLPFLGIAVLGLYLGVEGWRHGALRPPETTPIVAQVLPRTPDWARLGEAWAARARHARWHLDPALTLAALARHLGTNATYLSRALNEGLGVNFSSFVNGLRAEEVAARLRDGDARDLLELALEAGFSSKASFNRAFKARYGVPASEYRKGGGRDGGFGPMADLPPSPPSRTERSQSAESRAPAAQPLRSGLG